MTEPLVYVSGTDSLIAEDKMEEVVDLTADKPEEPKEDYEIILKLGIIGAKINNSTSSSNSSSSSSLATMSMPFSIYYAVAWITPRKIAQTPATFSMPNPSWNMGYSLPVDEPMDFASLKLEVIRVGAIVETGTSRGESVVGRARIPLLKIPSNPVRRLVDLVKLEGTECSLQGHIDVELELVMIQTQLFWPLMQPSSGIMEVIDHDEPPGHGHRGIQVSNKSRNRRRRAPRN